MAAVMCVVMASHTQRYKNQLSFMVSEYDRVSSMIHDTVRPLLAAHLDELDQHILPGEVVLQWTSMNIDPYLMSVHTSCVSLCSRATVNPSLPPMAAALSLRLLLLKQVVVSGHITDPFP